MSASAVVAAARVLSADGPAGRDFPLWADCAPGLEPEAAAELHALGWRRDDVTDRGGKRGAGALRTTRGAVHGLADLSTLYLTLWAARTVESVTWRLGEGVAGSLDEVAAHVGGIDLAWLAPRPFAVRARRRGTQPFRSPDIAGVAGRAVIDSVRARTGVRLPVDLDDPACEIRVDLDGCGLRVGLALDHRPLHQRDWRTRGHHAGLRPTTAAALLVLSGWEPAQRLVDPMAGGATITVEASMAALHRPPRPAGALPRLDVLGVADKSIRTRCAAGIAAAVRPSRALGIVAVERFAAHVALARANRSAAGLRDAFEIRHADARSLGDIGAIDVVVCNPPFGKRAASPRVLGQLYRESLARIAERLTSDGRVVWLTTAETPLREGAEAAGLGVLTARAVELGDLAATAYVLGR